MLEDLIFVPDNIALLISRLNETEIVQSKLALAATPEDVNRVQGWIELLRQRILIHKGDYIIDDGHREPGINHQFFADAIIATRQLIHISKT